MKLLEFIAGFVLKYQLSWPKSSSAASYMVAIIEAFGDLPR